jgi:hypothetical protein
MENLGIAGRHLRPAPMPLHERTLPDSLEIYKSQLTHDGVGIEMSKQVVVVAALHS